MTIPAVVPEEIVSSEWGNLVRDQLNALPPRLDRGRVSGATTDSNGDIDVTYTTPFEDVPAVFLTRRGATTTLVSAVLSATSTTGFSARMFVGTTRQVSAPGSGFDWMAVEV